MFDFHLLLSIFPRNFRNISNGMTTFSIDFANISDGELDLTHFFPFEKLTLFKAIFKNFVALNCIMN